MILTPLANQPKIQTQRRLSTGASNSALKVGLDTPSLRFGFAPQAPDKLEGFYNQEIVRALEFITFNHRTQVRKGTDIPYLAHVIGVAGVVMDYGYLRAVQKRGEGWQLLEAPSPEFPQGITVKDAYLAALMHDLIEDQDGMEEKIRAEFGDTVTKLVLYCSDIKDETTKDLSYNERKRRYLRRIASGPSTAILIAGADKLNNLRLSVPTYLMRGEDFWKDFGPKKEEKLQYYRDVIDIFRATGKYPELVSQIEFTFERLNQLIDAKVNKRPLWLVKLNAALDNIVEAVKLFWCDLKKVLFPKPQAQA